MMRLCHAFWILVAASVCDERYLGEERSDERGVMSEARELLEYSISCRFAPAFIRSSLRLTSIISCCALSLTLVLSFTGIKPKKVLASATYPSPSISASKPLRVTNSQPPQLRVARLGQCCAIAHRPASDTFFAPAMFSACSLQHPRPRAASPWSVILETLEKLRDLR